MQADRRCARERCDARPGVVRACMPRMLSSRSLTRACSYTAWMLWSPWAPRNGADWVPSAHTGAWSLGRLYARISALESREETVESAERRTLVYAAQTLARVVAARARDAFVVGVMLPLPARADMVRHVGGVDRARLYLEFALDLPGASARVPADRWERCACCPADAGVAT
jgi:hypothetical protein